MKPSLPSPVASPPDPDEIQELLDALPASCEPLDVVMVDGFLCGVLLQPEPVPEPRWLARVHDVEGRALAQGVDTARLDELIRRRHAALRDAISRRDWFDPWVYQLDEAASPSEAVMPWVAGFVLAVDLFPVLQERFGRRIVPPLAALVRHLPPDEIDDAELAELAEEMEPAADLAEAVEDLVSGVLLIADQSLPADRPPAAAAARRAGAGGGRRR